MVSVITITYNRAHLIGETIQSVLNQTYQDFEYIIIDDASEDNTEEIVRSFNDTRIQYFKSEKIGKLGTLRNLGIKKTNRKYIAFVDSDDLWDANKVQHQVELLEQNEELFYTFCNVSIFNESAIIKSKVYDKEIGIKEDLFFTQIIHNQIIVYPSSTLFFRKDCLNIIIGFDETMQVGDYDFLIQLSLNFNGVIDYKVLSKIRYHSTNHSQKLKNQILAHLEFNQSLENLYTAKSINRYFLRTKSALNYFEIAKLYTKAKHFRQAEITFKKVFLKNPLSLVALKSLIKLLYLKFYSE